jgi:serine/threonine protein kinase/Tol biopolymer transport system component
MIGTTISHYKILEKLGEGGMGVVYKAEDLKLERAVALKFLPPHLIASEQDKARFVQEAKSSSALNHPNVATVYEIDEADGQLFIAMEFVDGVTLREKMGTISAKQAIDMGIQLADGLAAAHEKGIVHRDVKPENIMVRKDGICQIMDFGLAKLRGRQSKIPRLTKEGSTIGTAGYMSPEQVQGQDVDHRSDIFSLGVVLYELFTGELPFKGVHETALLYEIVNVDAVPMSAVKPEIDPGLDAIVLECLAKEPAERYQSVAEAAKELRRFKRESTRQRVSRVTNTRAAYAPSRPEAPTQGVDATQSLVAARRFPFVWVITSFVCLVAAGAFAYLYFRSPTSVEFPVVFTVSPPEKGGFESPVPALSPDGRTIAYVGHDSAGASRLWIRSMGSIKPRPLEGTEGASFPFWSPDSRFIAFFIPGKLMKVAIAGGLPQTICDAQNGRGGSWNQDGTIVFAPVYNVGLSKVSASGGVPTAATALDSVKRDLTHRFPCFLPDGQHFAYVRVTGQGTTTGIYMASLDGKEDHFLFASQANAIYVSPGYLLSLREKSLVAYEFDPGKGEVKGDGVHILDNVGLLANYNLGAFSASQNGTVVVMEGVSGGRQLIWFDRTGKELERTVVAGSVFDFHLSPDESRVIFRRVDPQTNNEDIWVLDVARNVQTRFTFEPAVDDDPLWSPDGSTIIYDSDPEGVRNIYRKTSTGAGSPELILKSSLDKTPLDWSRDGKFVVYQVDDPVTKADLWILPLSGDKKPFPYLHSNFTETDARFSPDGKWIAYASDESGKYEVYLQHFPQSGGKWQVSVNGGGSPEWRRDGKEIYYISAERKLMAADIRTTDSSVQVGIPSPLFEATVDVYFAPNRYDVSADGQRFLVNTSGFEYSAKPMTVILNWTSQLGKQ